MTKFFLSKAFCTGAHFAPVPMRSLGGVLADMLRSRVCYPLCVAALCLSVGSAKAETVGTLDSGNASADDFIRSILETAGAAGTVSKHLVPAGRNRVDSAKPGKSAGERNASPSCPNEAGKTELDVTMELRSASLSKQNQTGLEQLATTMNLPQFRNCRFRIVGHADASGSAVANQKISERRAAMVRDHLISLKVEPSRLIATGKGSSSPLNQANPLAPENRRVELSIIRDVNGSRGETTLAAITNGDGERPEIFGTDWAGWIGQNLDSHYKKTDSHLCVGSLDRIDPPAPESQIYRSVHGWAWDLKRRRASDLIVLVSANGLIRGF
ncbi:OmpA family protein, partial [Skermanella aerolata]